MSSIGSQQLTELLSRCAQLNTVYCIHSNCISEELLVELARLCPQIQKVTLWSSEVSEKGVLALAVHCRQLQMLDISNTSVTEETVRQLVQHCRHLTTLHVRVNVKNGEVMVVQNQKYSSKDIRVLREIQCKMEQSLELY